MSTFSRSLRPGIGAALSNVSNLACAANRDQLVSALRLLAGTLKDRPRAPFGTI
jgi:hypothetical protein